ncbi:MAG: hypothetical protein JSW17_04145 [Candidatus Omnitrophota bacterium]|nr:MAG: hypothetical protein JSW17_04145 [Candidatus Omnitrophota bacterium]
MSRVMTCLALLILCFSPFILFAGSIGNSIEPIGASRFAIAADGNYATERDFEAGGVSTSGASITDLDIDKLYETGLKFIFGVGDYVNIYAKGGVAKLKEAELELSSGQSVEVEAEEDIVYGGGFNAVHKFGYEEEHFIGIGGDYSHFEVAASDLEIDGVDAADIAGQIKKTEYQGNFYAGSRVEMSYNLSIIPYVCGFWNKLNLESKDLQYTSGGTFIISFDNDADEEFGAGVGLGINMGDNFIFNVEGRFVAGTSISAGGTFKF